MKRTIKVLIWAYVVLLVVEGALRKWFLPSLTNPLLVVRDPVVLAIYGCAIFSGVFPLNRWMAVIAALFVLSLSASIIGGHTDLVVLLYGLRINYVHLPLIWIMGRVLDRRDVEWIGAFLLIVAVPMTLVMVDQFRSPIDAFVNRGVGTEVSGGQIFGADGHIRPPGLFAFITGPQLFFPLCAAFFFDEIGGAKRLPWYLLAGCGLAIAMALPISISRTVMLGTAVVAGVFIISLQFTSSKVVSLLRPIFLLTLVGVGLSQLPIFKEARTAFMSRWDTAAEQANGEVFNDVMDRTIGGFPNLTYYMARAPFLGAGIGTGSNVGARLQTGEMGFTLAEEEWGKIILELGPLLGISFIFLRVAMTVWLGWTAWTALRRDRNGLPILIFSASAISVLQGQWGPPTVLGFAVVGAGLLLGSVNAPANPKKTGVGSDRPKESKTSEKIRLPASGGRRLPTVLRPTTR